MLRESRFFVWLTVALALGVPSEADEQLFSRTNRTANVVVVNETGRPLRTVSVVHRYSCDRADQAAWTNLADRGRSSSFRVRYRTGMFTTGKDWWVITWGYEGEEELYIISPNNFRGIMDQLEVLGARALAETVSGLVATATGDFNMGNAAGAVAHHLAKPDCTTKGWKQHILRRNDEGRTTVLRIRPNQVVFESRSGRSSTEGIARIRAR